MKKTKVSAPVFKRANYFQMLLSLTIVGCLVAYIVTQTS